MLSHVTMAGGYQAPCPTAFRQASTMSQAELTFKALAPGPKFSGDGDGQGEPDPEVDQLNKDTL